MRRSLCLGMLFVGVAFALDVDSLPVWNPDYLVRGDVPLSLDSTSSYRSNISTHGYKSMQVTVGDGGTQVDQEMRLSVQGFLTENVYIDALLSDVDRTGNEQTTATLQEIDQIYFRVESPHFLLHLGDFTWRENSLGLVGFERSTLGAMVGVKGGHTEVRGAVGSDEVQRFSVTFSGVSGQRDGYSLGSEGNFLSVVPESETVWLNGVELRRGKDYVINYAGGMLDFKGTLIPKKDDEIRVDYDAYEDDGTYMMYAARGRYRSSNIHMDVSGFRLENDVDRMRRNNWTDDDYRLLRADDGSEISRDDSLGSLKRPSRMDKVGARVQVQGDRRFYADLETAFSRKDSNIVSDDVGGPEGRAFRWHVTSDSSYDMRKFPVALDVYGNFIEENFALSEYMGRDLDWASYKLNDEWDLDSGKTQGNLRHDDFSLRLKLWDNLFSKMEWGYRRGDGENWNSSRARFSVTHNSKDVFSEVALVRVASLQEYDRTRYQATADAEYKRGFVRPFGNMDFRYTQTDSTDSRNSSLYDAVYGKSSGGLALVADEWTVREAIGAKASKRKGREDDEWNDSLLTYVWEQSAEANWKYVRVSHVLQYEYSELDEDGTDDSWLGDLNASFGERNSAFYGDIAYKLGMTEEQTYVAVYKAVANGTGDVRYDSLTGTFIEGVDNGNFVYEGMGRNDSVGAVLASSAEFSVDMELKPGLAFGINQGLLRDITLGGSFSSNGEDTTGKRVYFPPLTTSRLRDISSGRVSWESHLEWSHPVGLTAYYSPGADYEKVMSSFAYFQNAFHHEGTLGFHINESNFVSSSGRYESVELNALQILKWNVEEGSLMYRYRFLDGFHIEPSARLRYGEGHDELDESFDASLKEGALRVGYDNEHISAFTRFAVTQMDDGGDDIPYQMMSGYGDGRTYRLEASLSATLKKNISLGFHYVLRFGDAEENVFQKLSSEARAFF